jgi:hypothetical protein
MLLLLQEYNFNLLLFLNVWTLSLFYRGLILYSGFETQTYI